MKVLMSFLSSFLLIGVSAVQAAPVPTAVGVHGMLLFGGGSATYASHLPMFHAPHDRQLVLKVSLKDVPGSKAREAFEAAKSSGPNSPGVKNKLFTIEPEVMDLEKIANGSKVEFSADLYDGHFERGGSLVGPVKIHVEKIVLSSPLHPNTPTQPLAKYLVFGESGKYFAVHLIQGRPSFDAVIEVSHPYFLESSHCRTRACADPVQVEIPDAKLPLTLNGPSEARDLQGPLVYALGDFLNGIADPKSVIYVEEGDLSH